MLGRCSKSFSPRAFSSMASSAPTLKSFNLALIQLGQIGSDKTKNIAHAREQVLKAASREDGQKPQLIVLPVSVSISAVLGRELWNLLTDDGRNVLILPTAPLTSPHMRRQSGTMPENHMTLLQARATPSGCSQPLPGRLVLGWSGVCAPISHGVTAEIHTQGTGSIPEREASTGNLYNTSTVYSPHGPCVFILLLGRCR